MCVIAIYHVYMRAKMALDRSHECEPTIFLVALREEFTRISLCPYNASSPHSPIPCFSTDQNFPNDF